MPRVEIKGIHRIQVKQRNGTKREYHYAWRGGPKFWSKGNGVVVNSPEYIAALSAVVDTPKKSKGNTPAMVDAFLDSAEFKSKKPRTQADYKRWALRFASEFKDDPAVMFEIAGSRSEVNKWRENWAHSPKQFDYAGTVVSIILNWARDTGWITHHNCDRLNEICKVDRSDIIWTNEHIKKFSKTAPNWVTRILVAACQTGLRPGDLIKLSTFHIESTPNGRRIQLRTNKRGIRATLPVTETMAALIDSGPKGLILTNANGQQLTEHRASEAIRQWRDKAGLSSGLLGFDLRLYDARGTAVTNLLNAGVNLSEIAQCMGWSIRTANTMIDRYAQVSSNKTDVVLYKLEKARRAEK